MKPDITVTFPPKRYRIPSVRKTVYIGGQKFDAVGSPFDADMTSINEWADDLDESLPTPPVFDRFPASTALDAQDVYRFLVGTIILGIALLLIAGYLAW
jgi:hypothetical protein